MKLVNFKTVSIKNFLSVGREPVTVDFSSGLHIITGLNKDKEDRRNGVGKSTIADAIHFAVFGTTIRDLKKEHIVNHFTGSDTEVVVEFDVIDQDVKTSCKVARTLEPSRCYLYINGEDKTMDTIGRTTDYICKLLNTTQDIFQNCVILTINNTVPFMAKKKVEKRKFIEGIFNLEVFGQMLGILRQEYNDTKRNLEVESTRVEEVDRTLTNYNNKKQEVKKKQQDRQELLADRKANNIVELNQLSEKIFDTDKEEIINVKKTIDQVETNIQACVEKCLEINKDISTYETEKRFKNESLINIGTEKDTCPVCLKPLTDHDRQEIENEKAELQKEIENITSKIKDSKQSLEVADGLNSKLKQAKTNQENLLNEHVIKIKESDTTKERIVQLQSWNKQIDDDVSNFKDEARQFDKQIKDEQLRLNKLINQLEGIKHKINILDVVKFIVSEEGVKSYIVRKILQLFNAKLSYYLQKMDANCCCIFNEYFEEEIVDEKGKRCSYHNFSGAERKNIDLACLFAFMDIRRLQGSVAYNFSVYDELLDSSLDERGVDLVLNILRERVEKYNECIMIISHRKESVKIGAHYKNDGGVIFLEKKNGITRRVDFTE